MTETVSRARRGPYAKSRLRQAEIVEAAIRVFAAKGYHGGSLREIAREIDMSLTAVTHHFPSKVDLLEAVLEETDRQGEEFATRPGFTSWVVALVIRNLDRPELLRMLAIIAAEASAADHPAHEWFVLRYERLRAVMIETVREDQRVGRIDPSRDAAFLADAVIALWDGLQLQWLIDDRFDMVERMRHSLATLLPESPVVA
ncbi:TetR family transcriptional regulator [Agromyces luteolus]|uniref:TetR family transcriptional regulator n=1 Tax=Agromyces luteolus TaxID=88373 RepID=A0A7C9LJJ4_9MICO|nr:TetR/AcrR family transcriptional regulator [Agromyces luteolus]MUN08634.1 TetR family transcriptional regulator [Agromyces luteolus]GLK27174.1 TetR family transcriptional regulator [Agromyces luteolus]